MPHNKDKEECKRTTWGKETQCRRGRNIHHDAFTFNTTTQQPLRTWYTLRRLASSEIIILIVTPRPRVLCLNKRFSTRTSTTARGSHSYRVLPPRSHRRGQGAEAGSRTPLQRLSQHCI